MRQLLSVLLFHVGVQWAESDQVMLCKSLHRFGPKEGSDDPCGSCFDGFESFKPQGKCSFTGGPRLLSFQASDVQMGFDNLNWSQILSSLQLNGMEDIEVFSFSFGDLFAQNYDDVFLVIGNSLFRSVVMLKNDGKGNLTFVPVGSSLNLFSNYSSTNMMIQERMISFIGFGDVNGDGFDDVVAMFEGGWMKKIVYLQNNGNGRLEEVQDAVESRESFDMYLFAALIDADSDGLVDLVTTTPAGVNFHKNIGSSSNTTAFRLIKSNDKSSPFQETKGGIGVKAVAFQDLDGDGFKDFLWRKPPDGTFGFYRNNGRGNFSQPIYLDTFADKIVCPETNPMCDGIIAFTDLEQNGSVDLYVVAKGPMVLTVDKLENRGSKEAAATFWEVKNDASWLRLLNRASIDFGNVDTIDIMYPPWRIAIWPPQKTPQEKPLEIFVVGLPFGGVLYGVLQSSTQPVFEVIDSSQVFPKVSFTGQVSIDLEDSILYLWDTIGRDFFAFRRLENGTFVELSGTYNPFHKQVTGGVQFDGLTFANLDGTGVKAFLSSSRECYEKDTENAFVSCASNPFVTVPESMSYVTFVDIDSDGDLDAVLAHEDFIGEEQTVALNVGSTSNPQFVLQTSHKFFQTLPHSYESLAIQDLDNDGDLDLVVFNSLGLSTGELLHLVNTANECSTSCTAGRGVCARDTADTCSPLLAKIVSSSQGLSLLDITGGKCSCEAPFAGDACEICAKGRYGVECSQQCPQFSTTLSEDELVANRFRGAFPHVTTIQNCSCIEPFQPDPSIPAHVSLKCVCPPGWGFDARLQTCEKCQVGFYSSTYDRSTCEACPANLTTFDIGATSQDDCETFTCPIGFQRAPESQDCEPCPIGQFRESQVTLACEVCPENRPITLSNGTASKKDCLTPIGTFLLDESSSQVISCEDPSFAGKITCDRFGMTLETVCLKRGFWRITNLSTDIRRCPVEEYCENQQVECPSTSPFSTFSQSRRMLENETNLETYCTLHHHGVFCVECETGYALSSNKQCELCTSEREATESGILAGWVLFAILIGFTPPLAVVLVTWFASSARNASRNGSEGKKKKSKKTCSTKRAGQIFNQLVPSAVIVIGFFQVFWQFVNQNALLQSQGLEDGLSFIPNLDLSVTLSLFSFNCAMSTTFYTKLLVATLWPVCSVALMVLVGLFLRWKNFAEDSDVRGAFLQIFFQLLLLIYPRVSSIILTSFLRDDFPRFPGDSAPYRALKADYSIDFDSDESKLWRVYAGIMAVVYPVGVLVLFFWCATWRSSQDPKSPTHFIVERYKPDLPWYETMDLIRKLVLTSCFLLVSQLSQQAGNTFFTCVSALSLFVFYRLNPYKRVRDQRFAEVSMLLIFALGYIPIAFQKSSGDCDWRDGDGERAASALVILVLSLELVFFVIHGWFAINGLGHVEHQESPPSEETTRDELINDEPETDASELEMSFKPDDIVVT